VTREAPPRTARTRRLAREMDFEPADAAAAASKVRAIVDEIDAAR
jgi:hypothetical protein